MSNIIDEEDVKDLFMKKESRALGQEWGMNQPGRFHGLGNRNLTGEGEA